jgi:hypothetical protein
MSGMWLHLSRLTLIPSLLNSGSQYSATLSKLLGSEMTNQGLEDEIAPIMREFKVSAISSVPSSSVGGGKVSLRCSSGKLTCSRES